LVISKLFENDISFEDFVKNTKINIISKRKYGSKTFNWIEVVYPDGSKDKKVARNEKRMEKSESKDKPVRRRKKLRENRPTNKF